MALFNKEKKKRKLTPREAKFFDLLAKNPTMTIADAGRQAGYAEATVQSGDLYRKVHGKPRNSLQLALEKAGLTEEYIAKKLHEGTNAFVTKVHQEKIGNNKYGNERYEYHKENQVDFKTRKEYIELIGKFNHSFVTNIEAKVASVVCNINKDDYMRIREEMIKHDDC